MQLTERLPRQPAWLLVSRILREQAQGMLAQLAQRVRLRDRARLAVEDFEVPDSAWARDAVELVAKVSPAFLLNHGVRSYAFGAALGRLYFIRFDPEVLFLAAVMHDLGLMEYGAGPDPFELQGARAARDHLLDAGFARERADLVHEAIALHASVGVASKGSPEVRLCHFGTGVDVAGLRLYEFERAGVDQLIQRWPRADFKCAFSERLEEEARLKPDSNIAGLVGLGFLGQVRGAAFAE